MTVIAQAQGVHPLFAGTDEPIGVDASGTRWAIAFQGRNAVLTATFAAGVSLEFKIPTTNTGGSKTGSVAAFTIPNFGDARWVTYREHVKFEVRFPGGAPKSSTVSVNVARLAADLVSDGAGGLDVLSGGVKVGALPRPWIDYTPDGTQDRRRVWLDWVVADPTMTLTLPTLTASEWQSAVLDPTVVTTSTVSTATAYSNQRKIDRCQNGVVWGMYWDGTSNTTSSMHFRYSTDDGATWSDGGGFGFAGTGTTHTPNGSFFIAYDATTGDERAVVVYKDRHNGFLYFRTATPNVGRTSWTWSAATALWSATSGDYPDVWAHREGTAWRAHVVFSRHDSTSNDSVYAARVDITSAGAVSVGVAAAKISAASYGNTVAKFPSIDGKHTGDGKTVSGNPDVFVSWSAGATGAGKGIRFKKAAYSGGSWIWGTEREIDSTRYINAESRWLNCLFDGTRAVIPGFLVDAGGDMDLVLHERDAADATTTTRALLDNAPIPEHLYAGSSSYDSDGNFYLFGRVHDGTTYRAGYRKWTRTTGDLSAVVADTGSNPPGTLPWVSAKRGYSGGRVEFIYTDGTASPYSVTYDSIALTPPAQHESGGATATVNAQATGAGSPAETALAGASTTVSVTATGAGTAAEHLSAGATASITTTATGAGQATEAATAGATATVNALATGAGTGTETASSAATSTITVTATGGGNAATETSAGATATVSVAATGGGVVREHAQGGTGATVTVVATGGTTEPQAESGGATATVQITAYTGSAAAEHASHGATATVTVHTTGRNPDAPPDVSAGVARASIRPNTARASIRTQKATATIRPNTAKAVIR